jgi:hypothetical protein
VFVILLVVLKKNVSRPYIPPILSQILKNEKGSKPMHNILKLNNCRAVCKLKWEQKLNTKFEDKKWNKFFHLFVTPLKH